MPHHRGVIHLIPLIIVGIVALAIISIVFIAPNLFKTPTQEARVELTSEYKNPLDKESQYTNPFSEYKNPFDNLK